MSENQALPKDKSEETYDTSDTVLLAKVVEKDEKLDGVGGGLLSAGNVDLDRDALVEGDGDVEGGVGSLEGRDGPRPHVLRRSHVGVLKHASLHAC